MKIDFTKDNGILNVSLEGRLDTTTASEFDSFLSEHYCDISALNLNCEKLVYISSAGLRVLLSAQKKLNSSLKLTNVGELVMEVFEMTGFSDILTIE